MSRLEWSCGSSDSSSFSCDRQHWTCIRRSLIFWGDRRAVVFTLFQDLALRRSFLPPSGCSQTFGLWSWGPLLLSDRTILSNCNPLRKHTVCSPRPACEWWGNQRSCSTWPEWTVNLTSSQVVLKEYPYRGFREWRNWGIILRISTHRQFPKECTCHTESSGRPAQFPQQLRAISSHPFAQFPRFLTSPLPVSSLCRFQMAQSCSSDLETFLCCRYFWALGYLDRILFRIEQTSWQCIADGNDVSPLSEERSWFMWILIRSNLPISLLSWWHRRRQISKPVADSSAAMPSSCVCDWLRTA